MDLMWVKTTEITGLYSVHFKLTVFDKLTIQKEQFTTSADVANCEEAIEVHGAVVLLGMRSESWPSKAGLVFKTPPDVGVWYGPYEKQDLATVFQKAKVETASDLTWVKQCQEQH